MQTVRFGWLLLAGVVLLVGSPSAACAQYPGPALASADASFAAESGWAWQPPSSAKPESMSKLFDPCLTCGRPMLYGICCKPFRTGNARASGDTDAEKRNGNGDAKKEPKHIRDNAFLVEEAFNQEPGVVQHIFNWVILWDRTPGGQTRDFTWNYTMELPLGSQKHQFSFTTQVLSLFEKPDDGPVTQPGGVGDTFLNYRYQLLADDDFLWCAPRFSLILPTGDERFGLGTGQLGYQFNLPISRYGDRFDFHFNAGFTYIPNVSAFFTPDIVPGGELPGNGQPLLGLGNGSAFAGRSPRRDLHGYNLGASAFWKPKTNLHFFVEALALWNEEIDGRGFLDHTTQVFVNPGVRYAVCQFEEVEWVIGVSAPIGLTRDTPDIGVFFYMSIEHTFRKIRENGGE
ncbi:MAG: hypothetical protein L0241_28375 [Planctomycetia bacterium]|nr:hypothetical protein [Planctomycetia bacterium]